MNDDTYAVILAAGKGTRMKSSLYKVLHPVCGKPMVRHVLDTTRHIHPQQTVVVVGHGASQVQQELGTHNIKYALQEEQLGTGHAVMIAREQLEGKRGTTVVLYGDTPLLEKETLEAFTQAHRERRAAVTVLTAEFTNPSGYGRIIRDEDGQVVQIVEEKDATQEEKRIQEINSGLYCFDNQKLLAALDQISNDNAQGEYYLTDCIEILHQSGERVDAYKTLDANEILGVNDRIGLANVERVMRQRINHRHMLAGVSIIDPEHTYIDPEVKIGQDTIIYPGTSLFGSTTIGQDCRIGPHSELRNVSAGDRNSIRYSVLTDCTMGHENTVGPYAHIRPDTEIGNQCRLGDFVEVKKSNISDGAKIPHLSYVGDADIGKGVNMGCGSITVNYDGHQKQSTTIGDHSFIGCNVNLIAPVSIGKGSYVAAGSTITDSVNEEGFAIARQRQVTKEDYAPKIKNKRKR